MQPRIEIASLRVVCPVSAPDAYVVYVRCLMDGERLLLKRSNGCEHMTAADVCRRCSRFVESHIDDPELARRMFPDFQMDQ